MRHLMGRRLSAFTAALALGVTGAAVAGPAAADPRTTEKTPTASMAEPDFIAAYGMQLAPFGHQLTPSGDAFTSAAEIGAATAIEFGPGGKMIAAAEPVRRGGGFAMVLNRSR